MLKETTRFTSPSIWITSCRYHYVSFRRCFYIFIGMIYWFCIYVYLLVFLFFVFHFDLFIKFIYFFVVITCYLHLSHNYFHGMSIFYLDLSNWIRLLGFVFLDSSSWIYLRSKFLLQFYSGINGQRISQWQ